MKADPGAGTSTIARTMAPAPVAALGIDAGGTQTRWALADNAGAIVAEGFVAGISANQMASAAGVAAVRTVLADLAVQVLAVGIPSFVCAGLTGFDGASAAPALLLAEALGITPATVTVRSDIDIAYRASFAPGEEIGRASCRERVF